MVEIRRLGLSFRLPLEVQDQRDLARITRAVMLLRSRLSEPAIAFALGKDAEPIAEGLEVIEDLGIDILGESLRAGRALADGRPK